jgi:hypothetical protein
VERNDGMAGGGIGARWRERTVAGGAGARWRERMAADRVQWRVPRRRGRARARRGGANVAMQ